MNKIAIHQFTPSVAYGDGVSDGVLFIQKILREFGFKSDIFISLKHVDIDYKKEVFHIEEYKQSENNYLLYHHSIGHSYHNKIMKLKDKKILIYHNITPSHFFKNNKFLQEACDLGRKQLRDAHKYIIHSIADSEYNKKELDSVGFNSTKVIPLLIDFTKKNNISFNNDIINKNSGTFNIIFVGRIVQNKCQHQLIDVAYFLKQKGFNFKLFIIGSISQGDYNIFLKKYIKNLSLNNEVILTGKVNDSDLASYYKNSDLYLSLSEHEGFGIPLIEAMKYDTPVLAFNICAIETTISSLGLLQKKSANYVVDKIFELLDNPIQKVEIIKEQKKILAEFDYFLIKAKFKRYLQDIGIEIENEEKIQKNTSKKTTIQIEGPFDSNYSLSIVNKNIALALDNELEVKLYSTEGYGDFKPNLENCSKNITQLYNHSLENIDITIRNLYPPRTNAMYGYHKIMGPYGWEESKFPEEFVKQFNHRTTLILTMSNYVKDILTYNGVYTPKFNTGIVADTLLSISSKSLPYKLPNSFKLLHISSLFPRKGANLLLEVLKELSLEIKLSLIIKTFPNPHNNIFELLDKTAFKKQNELEDGVFIFKQNEIEILLINKDISQEQIKYLYENSDLLVAPSFGEGFGLPLAESMLCNLPVLTTNYGGQKDFCNNENSWLLDFNFEYTNTHFNLDNSLWAVPKKDNIKSSILEIMKLDKKDIKKKTDKAYDFILNNYSKKQIAKKINIALSNYPIKAKKNNIALFSTYNTKCGIAKYSKYLISKFPKDIKIFANIKDEESIEIDSNNIIRCWESSRYTKDISSLKQEIIEKDTNILIIQYNFSFLPLNLLSELIEFCNINSIKSYLFLHSTADVITDKYHDSFFDINKSLQKVDMIFVHALKDLNYLKDFNIYKNTYLFSHGVDASLIKKEKEIIENKIPIIATFGFLLPHKGIMELIEAFEILHKQNVKVKLLLLNSLHPAPISTIFQEEIRSRINNSQFKDYCYMNNSFLSESEIIEELQKVDKIIFPYQNTQESSSAAVRMGLLSLNEVITTPLEIFDDLKEVVTKTKDFTPKAISETILYSLDNKYNNTKQREWIYKNSWDKISNDFYNTLKAL